VVSRLTHQKGIDLILDCALDLLHSGVPLLRSLDVVEKQTSHAGLKAILGEVHRRVEDGSTLADAMTRFQPVLGEMAVSMIRAYFFGVGPATVVPGGLHAFIKSEPQFAVPDIEFMFRGTSHHPHLWFPLICPAFQDGFGIRPTLLHPDSRGEVLLRSAKPRNP
jgi:choline dehydrogenase-like flavoprotein